LNLCLLKIVLTVFVALGIISLFELTFLEDTWHQELTLPDNVSVGLPPFATLELTSLEAGFGFASVIVARKKSCHPPYSRLVASKVAVACHLVIVSEVILFT